LGNSAGISTPEPTASLPEGEINPEPNPMLDMNSNPPGNSNRTSRSGRPPVGIGGAANNYGGVGVINGAVGHF
jgi:hypothetical protein